MPRLAGQIDVSKNEAILDAAVEVFSQRGAMASVEDIARRARVSRQTIYNHYGSKADLVRAVMDRRVHEITASLDTPSAVEHPAEALAEFGRVLLQAVMRPQGPAFMRMAMLGIAETPEVAEAIYEAGARASRKRLAAFLDLETKAGRLLCPDPMQAAEFFAGMVLGSHQTATLLGVDPGLDDDRIDQIATEAANRFMRAYAV